MGHQFNIRFKSGADEYVDTDLFTDMQPFEATSLLSSVRICYDDLADGLWVVLSYFTPVDTDEEGGAIDCAMGETYRMQVIDGEDIREMEWVKHNRRMVLFKHAGEIVNGVKLQTVASSYFSEDRLEDIRPVIADLFVVIRKEIELELNGEDDTDDEGEIYERAAARMGIPVAVLKDTVALYESLNDCESLDELDEAEESDEVAQLAGCEEAGDER